MESEEYMNRKSRKQRLQRQRLAYSYSLASHDQIREWLANDIPKPKSKASDTN